MEGLRVVRVLMKSRQDKEDRDWGNGVMSVEVSADSHGKGGAIDEMSNLDAVVCGWPGAGRDGDWGDDTKCIEVSAATRDDGGAIAVSFNLPDSWKDENWGDDVVSIEVSATKYGKGWAFDGMSNLCRLGKGAGGGWGGGSGDGRSSATRTDGQAKSTLAHLTQPEPDGRGSRVMDENLPEGRTRTRLINSSR